MGRGRWDIFFTFIGLESKLMIMGKGDKKTRRGKLFMGTYKRKKKQKFPEAAVKPAEPEAPVKEKPARRKKPVKE